MERGRCRIENLGAIKQGSEGAIKVYRWRVCVKGRERGREREEEREGEGGRVRG